MGYSLLTNRRLPLNVQSYGQKEEACMPQRNCVRLVVEVDPDLADRLTAWVKSREVTRKQVIIAALEEYFARHEPHREE